jgi:methionine biosynthesis protein MetW
MVARTDHKIIYKLIEDNSSVLDIGCGGGRLLSLLKKKKNITLNGIDIDSEKVGKALSKGFNVIQGDADNDLHYYGNKRFDYAILCQTSQVTKNPKQVIEQAMRIANKVIIVIPNFGYIQNRFYLGIKGKMPVTKDLSFAWYETPNIHFCTITDMYHLLKKELKYKILNKYYIIRKTTIPFFSDGRFIPNLFGKYGVFVVEEGRGL